MSRDPHGARALSIACVGGGPGGLLSAILLKVADPGRAITVYERNAQDDTFGFGVVFSQETLDNLESSEPVVFARIAAEFRNWSAIDVEVDGFRERSDGHAFAALGRRRMLHILAERAIELGVDVRFSTTAPALSELTSSVDLVIAADGVNSGIRTELSDAFGPTLDRRTSKYAWFGTKHRFDCFTFLFVETEFGQFWAHIYPFDDTTSTFIVEAAEDTWKRAGLDQFAAAPRLPGQNDEASLAFCERIFSQHLGEDGLIGNNSGWLSFNVLRNAHWGSGNVVLIGDAAHTAHFSIGSGTKLALEDAIALAAAIDGSDDIEAATAMYETERRPAVESIQRSAQTSLEWFEGAHRYRGLSPQQFVFQLLTRSQRVTYDNLKMRDPGFVARMDDWLAGTLVDRGIHVEAGTPPMFFPYQLRGLRLENRIVVSPMAQYSSVDGMPGEWHLVHLGSRAVGGAGLVMTEMVGVSPDGRITPGCPGIWNDEQEIGWKRIVDFVHSNSVAKIGLQIGHSGRKGSTKLMWDGVDEPLPDGGWSIMGPSAIPYRPDSGVPRKMTQDDINRVVRDHVTSAERGARAGFDLLELHFAHGYLVSSFLTPLANTRKDHYGGSLHNRGRLAVDILRAVRAVWPAELPISVRISATDWVSGGFDGDDAVELAGMLSEAGADIIDVSTGQTSTHARPKYGRLYQTPYSDRIRQETGIPTMAVGGIASVDDANTIIMSGRADLCVVARPHLVDPYWTLNASLDQGYRMPHFPVQYRSGRSARRRVQLP